jgi:hypothetical protein
VNLPQLQVLYVEELLNGVEVKLPPSSSEVFKKDNSRHVDFKQEILFEGLVQTSQSKSKL